MKTRSLILAVGIAAGLAATCQAQEVGTVVITEIMYNPHGADEGQEWVEIYNPTAAAVDLTEWALETTSGRTADIPSGTILAAHEVAVIASRRGGVLGTPSVRRSTFTCTQATWNTAWGPGIRVIFVESFWDYPGDALPETDTIEGLDNTGDTLDLINRDRVVIDRVVYSSDNSAETPWPDGNDSGSIQLVRDFTTSVIDNNNGAAWRISGPGDELGSRLANTALPAFPGLDSWGTPGTLANAVFTDCNGNSSNDAVDIVHGISIDSYPYNNIPDMCEGDCNVNGLPDLTEIALDWRRDRNGNRQLDFCEINAHGGSTGAGGAWDTNVNGILDSFETKPNIVISEIMYDPNGDDAGKEFVEIYNPGTTAVDISGWALRDLEADPRTGLIPAGTIMQPNEVIVLCAGSGPGVPANILTQFRIAWNIAPQKRVFALNPWQDRAQRATPIEEVLSLVDAGNEPVDVVNYENPSYASASLWPVNDTTSSISLLPTALTKSANDLGASWVRTMSRSDGGYDSIQTAWFTDIRATGSVGSPGLVWTAAHQSPTGEAVISEIMFHPNSDPGDSNRAEWIEIYNTGTTSLDLSGWYLRDEDGHTGTIAAGTSLDAGHVAVLIPRLGALNAAAAEADFRAAWGSICKVISLSGWSDFEPVPNLGGLANNPARGNEVLTLRKASGAIVDIVNFDDANGWPADAVNALPGFGTAWSIALLAGHFNAVDNDSGINWAGSVQGIDLAELNVMTPIFNGFDIASPGLLAGIVTTPECPSSPCLADFNHDSVVDFFDYLDFVDGFAASVPEADFNSDGVIDFFDYLDFVDAFAAGC